MLPKQAVLLATKLLVKCPHCGEPQPNPDLGEDEWSLLQVRQEEDALEARKSRLTCVSCDEEFSLALFSKVMVVPRD